MNPADNTNALREMLLDVAAEHLSGPGYHTTALEQIAAQAGCDPADMRALFPDKTALAAGLYQRWAAQTDGIVAALTGGSVASRFHQVMWGRLDLLTPYRPLMAALFSAAMQPDGGLRVHTAGSYETIKRAFQGLVASSDDAPRGEQAANMGSVLSGFYLVLILFWLYDRSPQQRASRGLVNFSREAFKVVQVAMMLPVFGQALKALADLLDAAVMPDES